MRLYRPLEQALFQFKPEKVLESWKDLQLGDSRNKWTISSNNERTQPTIEDILFGLERIKELKDKELLIELVNHYNEKTRSRVQQLLKEAI